VVSLIVARVTGFAAVGLVHFDRDGCFRVIDVRP